MPLYTEQALLAQRSAPVLHTRGEAHSGSREVAEQCVAGATVQVSLAEKTLPCEFDAASLA